MSEFYYSTLLRQFAEKAREIPGSSNGRTAAFEAVNVGSNPAPGAKMRWIDFAEPRDE